MYPFGYGLSYTDFNYSEIKVENSQIKAGQPATVSVTLENTGDVRGEEVAQLYLTLPDKGYQNPLYSLKGFQRVSLEPGESQIVKFEITPEMMESVRMNGERAIEDGEYTIRIGGATPHERSLELGASQWETASFVVSN